MLKRLIIFGIVFLSFLVNVNSAISDNNQAYYSWDSGSFADLTGNGNTATNNGTTNTSGIIDDARAFSGTAQFITVPDGLLIPNSSFTINMWIKPDTFALAQNILYGEYQGASNNVKNQFYIDNTGKLNWDNFPPSGGIITSTGAVTATIWQMVSVVHNGTHLEFYINCSLDSSTTFTDAYSGVAPSFALLGARDNAGTIQNEYDGAMDEVSLWNQTLEPSELCFLYNSGAPTTEQQYPYVSTPEIQSNLTGFTIINKDTINGSATTTSLVNMTFYLNGVKIGSDNNTNDSSYLLSGLSLGVNNISLKSVDINGTNWNNFSLTYQPTQYFYFQDSVGTPITNFELDGITYTNYAAINASDLSYGSNSLLFSKTGYENTTITFTLNFTSQINNTYTINFTTLTIKVYDAAATSTQLTFNLTIFNSTDTISYTNQLNFQANYSDIPTGDITLIISSVGYETNEYVQTITEDTSVSIIAYLFAAGADVLQFTVTDTETGDALDNVLIELQQSINGSYVTTSQKYTGSSGQTFFYADASHSYKLIFTKSGYVTATSFSIPTVLEYAVSLSSTTAGYEYIDDISYSFTPSATLLNSNATYIFAGFISSTGLTATSYTLYYPNGTIIFTDSSTNPTGTTFSTSFNIPYNVSYSNLYANLSYTKNSQTYTINKTYTIVIITNTSVFGIILQQGQETGEDSLLINWFLIMIVTLTVLLTGYPLLIIPAHTFLAYFGFLDWNLWGIFIFIAIVYYMGTRR